MASATSSDPATTYHVYAYTHIFPHVCTHPSSKTKSNTAVAEEEGGRAAAAAVLAFYPKQQQHGHKGNKYYASRILGNIFAMN